MIRVLEEQNAHKNIGEQAKLETEIEENAWLVSSVDSDKIMSADKDIWKKTLNLLGKKYKVWSNVPENPTMN